MIYNEIEGDLFTADEDFALGHCISADCKMGAGIAVTFKNQFPQMKLWLLQQKPKTKTAIIYKANDRPIINLITKDKYWQKPTYESFTASIEDMKSQMTSLGIKKLAIPKIGAGIDRLDWGVNRDIIYDAFKDTDIEIRVYVYEKKSGFMKRFGL